MIAGATYTLPLDIGYPVQNTDKIIITLKNESTGIKRTKRYPNDEETRLLEDGRIGARLTQQDTVDLVGYVKVEAQINLKSGSVAKTTTERTFISPTLNTEMVVGAADNGENLLDGVTLELGAPITVVAEGSEGTSFQTGTALELKDGILNVLTTDDAEKGNNLPITSEGARKLADNISYNDLKDRPFYEETSVGTIVESQTVFMLSFIPGVAFGPVSGVKTMPLVGESYTVVFDGISYKCNAWQHLETGNIVLGNGTYGGYGDAGEDVPFSICFYIDGENIECILNAEGEEHIVEVVGKMTTVHKLDGKFIDSSATKFSLLNDEYKPIELVKNIGIFGMDNNQKSDSDVVIDTEMNRLVVPAIYERAHIIVCWTTVVSPVDSLPATGEEFEFNINNGTYSKYENVQEYLFNISFVIGEGNKYSVHMSNVKTNSNRTDGGYLVTHASGVLVDKEGSVYAVLYNHESENDPAKVTIINKG